jgi:hypothetical protein
VDVGSSALEVSSLSPRVKVSLPVRTSIEARPTCDQGSADAGLRL